MAAKNPLEPASVPLDSVEWDFREITEAEAELAQRYEYAREIPELVETVQKWHSSPLKNALGRGTFDKKRPSPEWLNKTVREVLLASASFQKIPSVVSGIIRLIGPSAVNSALKYPLWSMFPEFPAPFLRIPKELRHRRAQVIRQNEREWNVEWSIRRVSQWALKNKWLKNDEWADVEITSDGKLLVEMNLGAPDEWLVTRIRDLRKELGRQLQHGIRGKSAFSGLRWLATVRLKKHGWTHTHTNRICDSLKKTDKNSGPDVIPFWATPISRCNALQDFEKRGSELFEGLWRPRPRS